MNQDWWRFDKLTGLEKRIFRIVDGIDWLKSLVVSLAKIVPIQKKYEYEMGNPMSNYHSKYLYNY